MIVLLLILMIFNTNDTVISKYIELYGDVNFISKYHDDCVAQIKKDYVIHEVDGVLIVSITGDKIPENPYVKNSYDEI